MGGKVWSPAEEHVFWNHIIPRSAKRLGLDRANPEKSWAQLATEMTRKMGENARRDYTELGLFEHYFQNAEKKRYSPNAAYWAMKYLDQKHEDQHGPKENTSDNDNDNDKESSETKRDPSPEHSETELPPFHQPNSAPTTPPAKQHDGSSEISENPASAPPPARGRHRPAPRSRVPLGNDRNRAQRHNRTENLAARMNKRESNTGRIQASKRATTSHNSPVAQNLTGNLDDPFVESSPHQQPSATSAEHNTPASHATHNQYAGGGYSSGNPSATHGHGLPPMTGTGYDYTMPSHNTGAAPPTNMYNTYPAAGLGYELPPIQSGGMSSFLASYNQSHAHPSFPNGQDPRARNAWEQYAGGYTTRVNNPGGQHGSSDVYPPHRAPNSVNDNPTGQQGGGTGTNNNNTLSHQGSTSAYAATGYHTEYQAAQPRYHPLPIREAHRQPNKTPSAPANTSGATDRVRDVSNDDNFVLASWDDDEDDVQGSNEGRNRNDPDAGSDEA